MHGLRSIGAMLLRDLPAILGMALFWGTLRYPNFLMILYPGSNARATASQEGVAAGFVAPHVAFLIVLFVLIFAAFLHWKRAGSHILSQPLAMVALAAIGSVGAALTATGFFGNPVLCWLFAIMVATGILALLLMWAEHFSASFGPRTIAAISLSYLVSLIAIRNTSIDNELIRDILTAAIPLGSGILWYVARTQCEDGPAGTPRSNSTPDFQGIANPYILLFVVFLLAGCVIRGVVDMNIMPHHTRYLLSIPVSAALAIACCIYAVKSELSKSSISSSQFVLACWVVFSLVFFTGIGMFLVLDDHAVGGSIVVIARSMLEVAFWMLLCDIAHRGLAPCMPLFLICYALVEALSWTISYLILPLLVLGESPLGAISAQALALVATFTLAAVVTLTLGVLLVLRGRSLTDEAGAQPPTATPADVAATQAAAAAIPVAQPDIDSVVGDALVDTRGLTPSEALVAVRYAHGYSLAKVAEELDMTKAAAQSHIRGAYRKLDVHTKDELIDEVNAILETCAPARAERF